MSELTPQELRNIYEAMVAQSGHPDPMGYMARIMLTSGGDPDYIDADGRIGLMPVKPDIAAQTVGSNDVSSLEGNVMTTLAMDIMFFEQFKNIDAMINVFHSGGTEGDAATKIILQSLDEARMETNKLIFPRRATFDDVIQYMQVSNDIDQTTLEKFKSLL